MLRSGTEERESDLDGSMHCGLTIHGRVVRVEGRRFAIEATEPIDLERLLAKSDLVTRSAMTANPGTGESLLHWSKQN